MQRTKMLHQIESTSHWDIIIIGGGASGLGTAVDAASRGFKTLLLERDDFAKGTSSRSTKLVHGGVRYLEQGDIPLVLEALRERGLLHQNAPHLVHHLSFVVPRYKWWEGPFFGIGLKVYDALAGRLNLAKSRMLSRDETVERIPNIEQENLLGGVEYFDGQFDDARLAITLAQTAFDHGAFCLNYAEVQALEKSAGLVSGVRFVDNVSGVTHVAAGAVVINATGIFADSIRQLDDSSAPPIVQPSQGVHLVFDRSFLRGDSAIMVPHTDDGRVLFVIPWHGRVLVGTTDTAMDHPDVEPRALPEEIGFILRNAARYLAKDPTRDDILAIFAGQRPLVRPPRSDGAPTKTISRNHEIIVSGSGLVTVVGGKWTTYRKMAEDTVGHAISLAGLEDRRCVTADLKLHGWRSPDAARTPEGLAVYGSDAEQIFAIMEKDRELARPLHERFSTPRAVVVWAARHEWAQSVEDVLARRTRLLILDARAAMECAPDVAQMLASELERDQSWIDSQIVAFRELAEGYLVTC